MEVDLLDKMIAHNHFKEFLTFFLDGPVQLHVFSLTVVFSLHVPIFFVVM